MATSGKPTAEQIHDLLTHRVVDVIARPHLETKLRSGRPLKIKLGRDARVPTLHLGHSVALRKLREFQKAGHQIVIILGDFTSRLGDPNGDQTREIMSEETIDRNVRQIRKIFDKILDPKTTEYVRNSKWLGKLNFGDVIHLASNFTVQQNIDRDLFQRRIKDRIPIGVHEFLYPIMQAYDSVMLECDLEVGGTDQTFNLLAGRTLMRAYGQEPQDILTTPMLIGTDGREMHASRGNFIALDDSATDMFGKLMGIRDDLIVTYLDLVTDLSRAEVQTITSQLKLGKISPIDAKKVLAREVVTMYHSASAAVQAQQEFESVIQAQGIPMERAYYALRGSAIISVVELLVESGVVSSKSEAKRLIDQRGVDEVHLVDGTVASRTPVTGLEATVRFDPKYQTVIQVGKRKAVELKP